MSPGYFVGLIIILLIIGEHFWRKKKSAPKELIIIIIAAIAAGIFAGLALEWALSLFRTFMQASLGVSGSMEHLVGNESLYKQICIVG